jgi:hypothetical protein
MVLDRLEGADGRAELLALDGVLHGHVEDPLGRAGHRAAGGGGAVRVDRPGDGSAAGNLATPAPEGELA